MAEPAVTIEDLRRSARNRLTSAGIESSDIDIKIFMREAFGVDASDLIARAQHPIPSENLDQFEEMLARRVKHEPVAYIIGKQPFWSLEFTVTPDVLIPRPETEGIVERALVLLSDIKNPSIVDIGTGSGALLLSLLQERKDATGLGSDISRTALDVANLNAINLGMAERAKFIVSDYLAAIDQKVDIVVSNPPYITDKAMGELSKTVADYEPELALRGGIDGLVAYKDIIADVSRVLRPGGFIVLEIGYDQGEAVAELLRHASFENVSIDKDLANHDRVVSGKLSA